jgi:hypothetical protein
LILHQQVVSNAFVELVDLLIFRGQLLVLALDQLNNLLQLKLQKGHVVAGLLTNGQSQLAVFVRHLKLSAEHH